MDRTNDPFVFAIGQHVSWLQPGGPRYVILRGIYVIGGWPQDYNAAPSVFSPLPAPQILYYLRPVGNILGAFWAPQNDLYLS